MARTRSLVVLGGVDKDPNNYLNLDARIVSDGRGSSGVRRRQSSRLLLQLFFSSLFCFGFLPTLLKGERIDGDTMARDRCWLSGDKNDMNFYAVPTDGAKC
ncbi:hypothetical protein L3X38_002312 [Prunus dulcis]|uniref:Uncharacterized protein n=1 Tax=Prunus dulcis TaxID=3755 RepID=A0AAD4WTT9_PRUDU|nr:hypothetical protein L3X38_002312 [Prunus dulcis]